MLMRDVLLIEDGAFFRTLLRDFLATNGYRTIAVASRDLAVGHVKRWEFRAIIMDYIDPGNVTASGFLHTIRERGPNQSTPVFIITALSYLPETLDVQAVLSKPFDLRQLISHLRKIPPKPHLRRWSPHAFHLTK